MDNPEMSMMNTRNALQMQVMTRKRYSWDIACEKDPATSSANFYEQLKKIRPYFENEDDKP